MDIYKSIEIEKNKLIKLVQTKGLYENFGRKESRKLEAKFINISDYTPKMNEHRKVINTFENWCHDYTG